jgi:hypothetical protein
VIAYIEFFLACVGFATIEWLAYLAFWPHWEDK